VLGDLAEKRAAQSLLMCRARAPCSFTRPIACVITSVAHILPADAVRRRVAAVALLPSDVRAAPALSPSMAEI